MTIGGIILFIIIMSLFEPILINFVYLRNINLFVDLFLNKNSYNKLKDYFKEESK